MLMTFGESGSKRNSSSPKNGRLRTIMDLVVTLPLAVMSVIGFPLDTVTKLLSDVLTMTEY